MHDTATLLSLHAGQAGKLIFNITAPEGVETTLQGAVMVAGHAVPMVATPAGELLVPALPAGCYRFECRACGATVLCGELDVHPSPLAGTPGQTSWSVAADLTQPLQAVAVTFLGGPQGPKGERGEKGEPGEQGPAGKDAPGVAEIVEAMQAARTTEQSIPTSTAAGGNAMFIAARLPAPATGKLVRLSLVCRTSGSICPQPLYLVVRTLSGGSWQTLGTSINACTQQAGKVSEWQFDRLPIKAGEQVEIQPSYTADGNTDDDAWVGCMVTSAPGQEWQCQATNGQWNNLLLCASLAVGVTAEAVYLTPDQLQKLYTLLQ